MITVEIQFNGTFATPKIYQVQAFEFHTFRYVSLQYANGDVEYLNLDGIFSFKQIATPSA
jgi:hypothetical protein